MCICVVYKKQLSDITRVDGVGGPHDIKPLSFALSALFTRDLSVSRSGNSVFDVSIEGPDVTS